MHTLMTQARLISTLTKPGVLIVGLNCLIDARSNKFGMVNGQKVKNPYWPIFKQVRAVGFVGADYEKAVNREANKQDGLPEFQTESLPWGEWLVSNKVIVHNGKFYLRTQTRPGNRRKQPAKVICYRNSNGQFISRDDVKPFLPVARESNKQQEETGIQETVWVRTYAFESIREIRIESKTYFLKP